MFIIISKVTLTIASGPQAGTYYRLACALKKLWESDSVETRVIKTNGSLKNLQHILEGSANIAIIQNDVLAEEAAKEPEIRETISSLVSIYKEVLQIVAPVNSGVDDISEMQNKKVILGYKQSGTAYTARLLLKKLDCPNVNGVEVENVHELIDSVLSRKVIAVFFMSKVPDPLVSMFMTKGEFKLIQFRSDQLRDISSNGYGYLPFTIRMRTYNYQYKDITTLAVPAVIVVRKELDSLLVYSLLDKLIRAVKDPEFDKGKNLRDIIRGQSVADIYKLTKSVAIPLHKGAEGRFKRLSAFSKINPTYITLVGYLAILTLLIIIFFTPNLKWMRKIFTNIVMLIHRITGNKGGNFYHIFFLKKTWTFIRAIDFLFIVWISGAILLFFIEHNFNDSFSTIPTAFESVAVYILSGFEDRMPISSWGWVVSGLMLFFGIIAVAFLTGQMTSFLVIRKMEDREMYIDSKCIYIIGWSSRVYKIIDEIKSAMKTGEKTHAMMVLTDTPIDESERKKLKSKGIVVIIGDTFDKDFLKTQGIYEKADSVIIIADDKAEDPDAKSVMIVLALKKLFKENEGKKKSKHSKHIPIIVEVKNHRKMDILRDAGADVVICHEDYGLGVIAQSAFAEKAADVYHKLLHYSEDTNEIYIVKNEEIPSDIKTAIKNKIFKEVVAYFLNNRRNYRDNPCILIGFYKENERVELNPRNDLKFDQDKDGLIFIAWKKPKL